MNQPQIFEYKGEKYELPDANTWQHGNRMEYAIWPKPKVVELTEDQLRKGVGLPGCETLLFELADRLGERWGERIKFWIKL